MLRRSTLLSWSAILLWAHLCAIDSQAQAISRDCSPAQEELKAAESAATQEDWSTASTRYQAAMQIAPSCVEAAVNLGVIYNRLNKPEEAVRTFKKALDKNPNIFAAHLNLGITYFRTARYDLAEKSLRTALSFNAQHTQARQLLALTMIARRGIYRGGERTRAAT